MFGNIESPVTSPVQSPAPKRPENITGWERWEIIIKIVLPLLLGLASRCRRDLNVLEIGLLHIILRTALVRETPVDLKVR